MRRIPNLVDANGVSLKIGQRVAFLYSSRIVLGKIHFLPDTKSPPMPIIYTEDRYDSWDNRRRVAIRLEDITRSGKYDIDVPPLDPILVRRFKTGEICKIDASQPASLTVIDEDVLFADCL